MISDMLKKIVLLLIERKARKYLAIHQPLVVAVTGSVGKTSTKMSIAAVLSQKYRVRVSDTNYNTRFSVPLTLLGVEYPENVHSVKAWRLVLRAMNLRIKQPKDVDIIVQELGTDAPGDVAWFSRYLTPAVAVVTAVSPEHMQFFADMTAVAQEELSVANFSKMLIINRDDIDSQFAQLVQNTNIHTYGLTEPSEYRLTADQTTSVAPRRVYLSGPEWPQLEAQTTLVGDHSLKPVIAAACVGARLGVTPEQIVAGVQSMQPVAGRMQPLEGIENSLIIDDSYNASPLAVEAALRTLYDIESSQRIAVIGSMNELGEYSRKAHELVGSLCDYEKLEWVVTIGEEAEKYLAPAAKQQGCQVRSFRSPYQAGGFVNSVLRPDGAVVLFKGSQNGVFAEEAIKVILKNPTDEEKLVRQSEAWMKKKQEQFNYFVASHEITDDD